MKKKYMVLFALVAIAVMVFGVLSSGAWFTDTKSSTTPSTISSGNLELNGPGITSFYLGTIPPMAPGDKTGPVSILIKNDGNIPLAWFGDLVVTGNGDLKKAVYIESGVMEFLGGQWIEPVDTFITKGIGAGNYPGCYNAMALANEFNVVGLDKFDGTSCMGVAPYEFTGALKPGFSYKLTLNFGFAELAGNSYENLNGLNISFKVDAQQVKENALTAFGYGLNNWAWLNTQLDHQIY